MAHVPGTARGRRDTEKFEGRERIARKRFVGGIEGTLTRDLRRDRHLVPAVNPRLGRDLQRVRRSIPDDRCTTVCVAPVNDHLG
jgi:hypothetical protein